MRAGRDTPKRDTFWYWLAVVSVVGLAIRLIAVGNATRTLRFDDGLFFHLQANFLATGTGFVDAGKLAYTFVARPSAQHPPLFPLLLAAVSKLGGRSVLSHQLTGAAMSSLAVPLIGLTAREVGGSRSGLAAAGIAAVYPNLWASDVWVMSESLYVTMIALVLFTSCRLWKRPSIGRATLAGVAIGLAALTRQEAILLLPIAVVPLCLRRRDLVMQRRVKLIGAACLAAVVVTAPWVVRNLVTFDRPVFLATNADFVVAGANCFESYHGPGIGSWASACNSANLPAGDESLQGAAVRARGIRYARANLTRLPVVAATRVGRAWELFRPFQGIADNRSRWMRRFGVFSFWLVLAAAVVGAGVALRRSMSLVPFVGQAVVVTVSALFGYGLWRLSLPVDVAAITLAGVAVPSRSWLTDSRKLVPH